MAEHWLAKRTGCFDASGIRKVFDLGARLKDPINLSIGQPDFDMPPEARKAAIAAIENGKSGYTPTQGLATLREKLRKRVAEQYPDQKRELFVSSGTSGSLVLAMLTLIDPGDEVIVFDPYFVMYDSLCAMVGGVPVYVDTYPDFKINVQKVADAVSSKTKAIIFNSPANPTGHVASREEVRQIATLAKEKDVLLISDEIYSRFCHEEFVSPAEYNPDALVMDGFSKSYGMPGWRLGYAHGPEAIIEEMIKFQQYTFVCAPHVGQEAALAAMETDMNDRIEAYRKKRDMLIDGIGDLYELGNPSGAFYMFPKAPWGTGTEVVTKAIKDFGMLIIPGSVFSRRDTHFRISYAADDAIIERGIEALRKLAVAG
jgi:aspartate aminotransferase/aminotransferase